nr:benzoate 4-monooxygenase [Quercus suber]
MLEKGQDVAEVKLTPDAPPTFAPAIEVLNRRGEVSNTIGTMPWIKPYAKYLPDPFFYKGVEAVQNLAGIAIARVNERLAAAERGETTRVDLLARLMEGRDENGQKLGRAELTAEALTQLIAGSDTTSNTSCALLFHCLQHPEVVRKLQAELDKALPSNEVPSFDQVRDLPYMDMVVQETLRIHSTSSQGLPRLVPPGPGVDLAGHHFPQGVVLSVPAYTMHHSHAIWGADADVFRPERWETVTEQQKAAFIPFSYGPRACVGRNVAEMELALIVATVFRRYEFEPYQTVLETREGFLRKPLGFHVGMRKRQNSRSHGSNKPNRRNFTAEGIVIVGLADYQQTIDVFFFFSRRKRRTTKNVSEPNCREEEGSDETTRTVRIWRVFSSSCLFQDRFACSLATKHTFHRSSSLASSFSKIIIMPEVTLGGTKGEQWARIADEYTAASNSVVSKPIDVLLEHANALQPFSRASAVFDNGCGPGPLMSRLLETHGAALPPATRLLCADFSAPMLAQVEARIAAAKPPSLWTRVETQQLDATDLADLPAASFSHVLAGMVYFLTPDPRKCLEESRRVLAIDGVVSCSAWESSQWLDLMHLITRVRGDKRVPPLPEIWSDAGRLGAELREVGFRDVRAERVDAQMRFESHEACVELLVSKLPHMVALTEDMSDQEVAELKALMVAHMKELEPNAPGVLKGVALVASGKK